MKELRDIIIALQLVMQISADTSGIQLQAFCTSPLICHVSKRYCRQSRLFTPQRRADIWCVAHGTMWCKRWLC